MPNSFSRFLSEEELKNVRDLYLQSLAEAGIEDELTVETTQGKPSSDLEHGVDHSSS